jgi:hypothetical protein
MSKHLPIPSASRWSVSEAIAPGPQMGDVLAGWFKRLDLIRVVKKTVDYKTVETLLPVTTFGVIVALGAADLERKPEGQRTWTWKRLHCTPELILKTDDAIQYKGVRYRVESVGNYDDNGFVFYDVVIDYEDR